MDSQVNQKPPKPTLLDSQSTKDRKQLAHIKDHLNPKIIDRLESQITELFQIRHPQYKKNLDKTRQYINDYLHKKSTDDFGNWVYYPWNNTLIHILKPDEFFEIRTARNKPLISKKDQHKFYDLNVGVIGLSVGNSIALSLAYSGGCQTIKLADSDTLELSNLNRVRASITQLGENKTYVTAKQIYEINPYANLILYPDGINPDNLKSFLLEDPKLDLLIDECDDITLKFNLRLVARSLKLPLLMITDHAFDASVDLLRFDRNQNAGYMREVPQLEIDQVIEALKLTESLELSPKEELQLIAKLLKPEHISKDMQHGSIQRVKHKVAGWPQLAMTVFAGGALAAYSALQIAKKSPTKARKSTFSFHSLLKPGYHSKKTEKLNKKHTQVFKKFISSLS